uniref:Uncharacterized protein n=1 Tax=Emiliania huxleyi (strain CCMP1516) TaxID=280463 RepID=A0A0D3JJI1_EMIH1
MAHPDAQAARRAGKGAQAGVRGCRWRDGLDRVAGRGHDRAGARPQDNQGRGRRAAQPAHHARRLAGRRRRRDLVQQRGRRRAQQVLRAARRGGLPLSRPPRRGGCEPQADALHRWRAEAGGFGYEAHASSGSGAG